MKADFHIRSYENSTLYSSFESGELLITQNQKIKYLIPININDSIKIKQMILAYKVVNDGVTDKHSKPHWIYVDDILKVNNSDRELFAVQYEGHKNHKDYAEFPTEKVATELFDTLTQRKWQSLNCLTHTLTDKKAYQLSEKLSQHLLDFYHENKPSAIDEYDLEQDLLKNKAIKTDLGWQIKINDYQINFLLKKLSEDDHPIEIKKLRAQHQDESIVYLNLDRRDFDIKLGLQASVDDDTLISEPHDVEQFIATANMLINGGSVELFVFALRKPDSNNAWVGSLNLLS
ncbi:hypothetical protein [Pseudoalteromonas distincta]|uniref:Uncharacterized protein n=1 Tax=Pseudoalteromonas distincta TaxID=77608 RepID=A0A4P9IXY5_9GAMM|nr:hypothetical protein [Pseudoalteromonas distincta]MBE3672663.1 hypothetical protein [Pseudoalteromonas distincta KMM 3548]QCU73237.1 hypothetical protein FFU37_01640 [Pseudoalteromonas distincta]